MNNYMNMLGAAVAGWVSNSFPVIRMILMIIIALCAIALICVVLCQESDSEGATALTGAESYYAQNKGRSKEGMLKKATIILSIIIVACVVVYFILTAIYPYAG